MERNMGKAVGKGEEVLIMVHILMTVSMETESLCGKVEIFMMETFFKM
jgi:hypothetical protein